MGSKLRVMEVMKRKPLTVAEDTLATNARSLFRKHGYRSLPVLSNNEELMGIVERTDILKTLMYY